MSDPTTAIALVVGSEFADRLSELAQRRHVWAEAVAPNDQVANRVWQNQARASASPWAAPGITLFALRGGDRQADAINEVIDAIADHHGQHSQFPPWTSIEVLGLPRTSQLEDALREIGARQFQTTDDGFECFSEPDRDVDQFLQSKRVETQFGLRHIHHNQVTGETLPVPHVHDMTPGGVRAAQATELPRTSWTPEGASTRKTTD